MRRRLGCLGLVMVLGLAFAPTAHADIFELTLGMRAGAGAEFLSAPSNSKFDLPQGNPGEIFAPPFFDDERSGYNYTIGWYAEMRFVEYFGIEVGLGLARHFLVEEVDWRYELTVNGNTTVFNAKSEETLSWSGMVVPILVKGIYPVGGARIWLGIGPEFWLGQWSKAKFERKELDSGTPANAPIRTFQNLGSRSVHDTYITWALGVDIVVDELVIPIALKFGWNLDQPDNYLDRVSFDLLPQDGTEYPTSAVLRASDSLYGQLLIGIAYDAL